MQPGRSISRRWSIFALVFTVGIVGFVFIWQASKEKRVVLGDGTQLTLQGITYGEEHYMTLGRPGDYLLEQVPEEWLAKLPWLQKWRMPLRKRRLIAADDKLVVWFALATPMNAPNVLPTSPSPLPTYFSSDPLMIERYQQGRRAALSNLVGVPWTIAGPDGTEAGAIIQTRVLPGLTTNLHPVVIDSYPRRARQFAFRLYQPGGPGGALDNTTLAEKFVIQNPKISRAPFWTPEILPSRKVSEGLTCVLRQLLVAPRNANPASQSAMFSLVPPWPPSQMTASRLVDWYATLRPPSLESSMQCQAVFELFENDLPVSHWAVRGFRILDPTGNVSEGGNTKRLSAAEAAASAAHFGSRTSQEGWSTSVIRGTAGASETSLLTQTNDNRITCFSAPLWPDEPAWKIQVDLLQMRNFSAKSQVVLDDLPFPPEPGTRRLIRETELSGYAMKIYAVGAIDLATARARQPPVRDSAHPYLVFEFDLQPDDGNRGPPEIFWLLEAKDDRDQSLRVVPRRVLRPKLSDTWELSFTELIDPERVNEAPFGVVPRDIKSIDVTVVIPEQRTFEFLAKPTWIKTSSEAKLDKSSP